MSGAVYESAEIVLKTSANPGDSVTGILSDVEFLARRC